MSLSTPFLPRCRLESFMYASSITWSLIYVLVAVVIELTRLSILTNGNFHIMAKALVLFLLSEIGTFLVIPTISSPTIWQFPVGIKLRNLRRQEFSSYLVFEHKEAHIISFTRNYAKPRSSYDEWGLAY